MTFTALFRSQIRQLMARARQTRRPDRFQCRPAVLSLEERALPSIVFDPIFGAETQRQDGGAALSSPPVYLIFWGSWWGGTNSAAANSIKTVAAKVLSSPYLSGLRQYHSDGFAQLNSLSAYDSSNPADLGFNGDTIDNVVQNQIDNGPLPESDTPPHTPIYVVVTPPGIQSGDGRGVAGFNQLMHDTDVCGPFCVDYDDIPEVWTWTGNNGDRTINIDQFTLTFSHEVAEIMSDLGGGGYEVNPGQFWRGGGSGNQIGDYEGNAYSWREPNGADVQPYWSARDQRWLAPDGNAQAMFLHPNWLSSYTGNSILTVNGDQLANHNDTITIDVNGGGVRVTLNGEVFQFAPGQISSITVNSGTGNDTVNIEAAPVPVTANLGNGTDVINLSPSAKNLANIQSTLTLNGTAGSSDTLNVFDQNAPGNLTYSLSSATFSRTSQVVFYSAMTQVTINGGNGTNTYKIDSTRGGTPACVTTLNIGTGSDEIDVRQTFGPLTINEQGSGNDTVNLSPVEHNLGNIQAAVTVHGSAGNNGLVVHDEATGGVRNFGISGNNVAFSGGVGVFYDHNRTLVVNGGGGSNTYTVINTAPSSTTTLNTGTGSDEIDVRQTSGPLTINEQGSGNDTVNLSHMEHNLGNIPAAVTVHGSTGNNGLFLHDESTGGVRNFGISGVNVAFSGGVGISYDHIRTLVVNGGSGNNTYTVVNTAPSCATTVNTGGGTDMVDVKATGGSGGTLAVETTTGAGGGGNTQVTLGNNGSVAGILGAVSILNVPSYDQLTIDDSADSASHPAVTVAGNGITGLAPSPINFTGSSVKALTINGGTGTNSYTVAATPVGDFGTMTLNTGRGPDTVWVEANSVALTVDTLSGTSSSNSNITIGNAGSLAGIRAAVTIHNGPGYDNVAIDDSADGANHPAVTVSNTGVTGLAPSPINFSAVSVGGLTITGGTGTNGYTIADTPVNGTGRMTLHTGPGPDTVLVQANTVPLTVDTLFGGSNASSNVTIGNAGSLAGIRAAVTIYNGAGYDTLTIDDSADSTSHPAVTVNSNGVTGLAPSPINFTSVSVTALTIDGGTGNNNYTIAATPVPSFGNMTLNTGGTDAVSVQSASAPLTIIGNGGWDTLTGASAANHWEVTTADAGVLSGSAYAVPVGFGGIQNLTAGAGPDYFLFDDGAYLDGSIAGSGTDTLDYTPYTSSVIVDLQAGLATGLGGSVSGIQNVSGGSGAPGTPGLYNLLIGNGGNTLTGGTGRRNILVAGGSAGTLIAGDMEDLLIGGSTIYDNDPTDPALQNWQAIAAYWAGTDDYFTRVANLTSGNGVPLLDATTVTGNGGGNTMIGNGALALIYSDGMDNVGGFDPNSILVPVSP